MKHKQEVPVEVVEVVPPIVPPMAVTEVIEVDSDDEGACYDSNAVADCLFTTIYCLTLARLCSVLVFVDCS